MKNTHRVPVKQWYRWSDVAKRVFNSVYEQMTKKTEMFLHPDSCMPISKHWKTTCWNAAWTAADAVDNLVAVAPRA